jgi:hypothetical protein
MDPSIRRQKSRDAWASFELVIASRWSRGEGTIGHGSRTLFWDRGLTPSYHRVASSWRLRVCSSSRKTSAGQGQLCLSASLPPPPHRPTLVSRGSSPVPEDGVRASDKRSLGAGLPPLGTLTHRRCDYST